MEEGKEPLVLVIVVVDICFHLWVVVFICGWLSSFVSHLHFLASHGGRMVVGGHWHSALCNGGCW